MHRTVVILDDTPESQSLGMAMLESIGTIVNSIQFTTVDELPLVPDRHAIYCPLTLNIPADFAFWGRSIFQTCNDIIALRQVAGAAMGVKLGDRGQIWLPIIWAVHDPNYGEVIAQTQAQIDRHTIGLDSLDLHQLQQFSSKLLTQLTAPPATYLVQFDLVNSAVKFDRLFPFPAPPALATINRPQQPDLFKSHWQSISRSCS